MIGRRDVELRYASTSGSRRIYTETYTAPGTVGPDCIALHSGPGFGAATLRAGVEVFAAEAAITLVDLPGCGRSSRHPASGYPIASYIDDVMQVRQGLGLKRPLLLGHGWGAMLAVEAALAHPTAFCGLLLLNPLRTLAAEGQDTEAQQRQAQRIDDTLLPRFATDVWPALQMAMQGLSNWDEVDRNPWFPQMWATQWATSPTEAWNVSVSSGALGMEAYFAHKGQAMFDPESYWARFDLASRMERLGLPVSVMASEHDANYVALPHIHVHPLRRACSNLQVEIVGEGGHFLLSETPHALARHLQSCLLPQVAYGQDTRG